MSQDKEIYCICKKPAGYNRFMICCDNCDRWFHGSCVKITKSTKPRGQWLCPPCECDAGKPDKNATAQTKADVETQLNEFKISIISDVTSNKEQLAFVNSEVQILKAQVCDLQKNQEKVEQQEKEFKDMLQQKNQERLKQKERELVQLYEQKYQEEVEKRCKELKDTFEQKIQEELMEKEKEFKDKFDAKKRFLDEEWEEKLRNVERECASKVNEVLNEKKKILKDLKEKLDEKCKELEKAKKEIQSLKNRTTKSLSLKKTFMSQPVNLKRDQFDLRDEEDFKTPPK